MLRIFWSAYLLFCSSIINKLSIERYFRIIADRSSAADVLKIRQLALFSSHYDGLITVEQIEFLFNAICKLLTYQYFNLL